MLFYSQFSQDSNVYIMVTNVSRTIAMPLKILPTLILFLSTYSYSFMGEHHFLLLYYLFSVILFFYLFPLILFAYFLFLSQLLFSFMFAFSTRVFDLYTTILNIRKAQLPKEIFPRKFIFNQIYVS